MVENSPRTQARAMDARWQRVICKDLPRPGDPNGKIKMSQLNETHDPARKSWVESANHDASEFPLQNLPYGVFSRASEAARPGVAIGDQVLDLKVLEEAGLLDTSHRVFGGDSLNAVMALERPQWRAIRGSLSALLATDVSTLRDNVALREQALIPVKEVQLHMPVHVRGYTDFYSSREHATNVGMMFRDPENALMPNWLHIPIGYNGRASTVVVSGTDIVRPLGQTRPPGDELPTFGPCRKLDIELEMGALVGGGNAMGTPISVREADAMIFGYVLLNDWSARDIQVWEYQPLGPFQAKAFGTTISPWVVTQEALEPFRVAGPQQDPTPLPYLHQDDTFNFDIGLEVSMRTPGAEPTTISRTNFKHMYWSSAQQLAHHAVGGCAMEAGDLLGSGTISGNTPDSLGSLLELTWNGTKPLTLKDGISRTFIEDGDTLTLSGVADNGQVKIGFGEASGTIVPSPSP